MRLSKSDKNVGASGWRVDSLFKAEDSVDVIAHPHIVNVNIYILT